MKTFLHSIIFGLFVCLFAGCASLETVYIPDAVGLNSTAQQTKGLKISIRPEADAVVHGDVLTFELLAHNVSNQAMYLPREPDLMFCWVYPTGRRDNHLLEMETRHFYQPSGLIRVEPGQTVRYSKEIETYYFPKRGITEFAAIFHAPRNTNPGLQGVWTGEAKSNSYGVLLDKASRIARYEAEEVDKQVSLTVRRNKI